MNIYDFGIISDEKIIQTEKIQNAIDVSSKNKEKLIFTEGTYVTTTLYLRDHTHIILEKGALIIACPDYREWIGSDQKPVILAENLKNVSVTGEGTISCNGKFFHDTEGNPTSMYRPNHTIEFSSCKGVELSGITLRDSVTWTIHFDDCENVLADNVTIRNPDWWSSHCSDGFDINGCRHFEIKNCDIETGDDAICLKNYNGGSERNSMYDIYIHDCLLRTTSHGVKIGTETQGDIYDVRVENILLKKHRTANERRYPDIGGYPLVAFSVQSNDGASVHDISCKNMDVEVVDTPLFFILQNRTSIVPGATLGRVYNITVDNMTVNKCVRGSQINVSEFGAIENVRISNFEAHNYEEYDGEYKALVPEGRWYPDAYNFGHMPAYGLFARNVENLEIGENVKFYDETASGRDAVVIEKNINGVIKNDVYGKLQQMDGIRFS